MSRHIESLIEDILHFDKPNASPDEWQVMVDRIEEIGELIVPSLVDLLPTVNYDQRSCIAWALGRVGSKKAAPALTMLLDDNIDDVVLSALHALGVIGVPQAVPAIASALFDDNEIIQIQAAISLGYIDHDNSVDALITALDFGEKVRGYALSSLEKLGKRSIQPLVDYMEVSPDDTFKGLIMGTLTRIGTPEALSAVESFKDNSM